MSVIPFQINKFIKAVEFFISFNYRRALKPTTAATTTVYVKCNVKFKLKRATRFGIFAFHLL
jgi:hypothetical protein